MKLYFSPGACSLAPHIAMCELGLAHQAEPVDLKTHHFKGGDFYQKNAKGQVPTLELDNGQVLTEAAVILQYLADQKPESNLLPKPGTWERYRAQEWLNYVASEMHKGLGALFRPMPDDYKTTYIETQKKKIAFLEKHFATNEYLMASHFTAADAYLFTVLNWTGKVGIDLSPFTNVGKFMARVKARPGVQTAMKHEGLMN